MRAVINILLLQSLLIGCGNGRQPSVSNINKADSTATLPQPVPAENKIDTTVVSADSAVVDGTTYRVLYKSDDILYVINAAGDTILKAADLHPDFEFIDFNGDGYKDICIHYHGNVPLVEELLLFDKPHKTFKFVENFAEFPDPRPLKGTKYFYSYHRSGCGDMNWASDLFYLDNFQAIKIGHIAGYQCENRDVKDGIYISRVKGEKEILLETKPVSILEQYNDYKWGFIKAYWAAHYRRFL